MVQAVIAVAVKVIASTVAKKILLNLAITVATSVLQKAFAPKRKARSAARVLNAAEVNQLSATSISDRQGIYGETALAGEIKFAKLHADGQWVSYVIHLADGGQLEPHTFVSCLIDGVPVTFDGSGNATGNYASVMKLRFYGGSPTQTADSQLIADAPGLWTSAHRGRGICYVVWSIKLADEAKFPNGRPDPLFRVRGRALYDPRLDSTKPGGSGSHRINDESTWEWSNNAALVIYDFARGVFMGDPPQRVAGLGLEARLIDEAWVIASANACDDESWTIDGPFTFTEDPYPTLTSFAEHMGGRIASVKGRLAPIAGYDWPDVLEIGSDDLAGPLQIDSNREWREAHNTVRGSYRDPDSRWEVIETDEIQVSAWVTEDRGQVFELGLEFPFKYVFDDVKKAAQVALYRDRAPRTISGPFKLRCAPAYDGSMVTLNLPEYGISERYEVETRGLEATGFVTLSLRLYDPAEALDFAGGGSAPGFAQIDRPGLIPPNPSGWTAAAGSITSAASAMPAVYVEGVPPADVQTVIIEWRPGSSGDWRQWTQGPPVSAYKATITGLAASASYQVRITYRNGRALSATPQIVSVTTGSTMVATGMTSGAGVNRIIDAGFRQGSAYWSHGTDSGTATRAVAEAGGVRYSQVDGSGVSVNGVHGVNVNSVNQSGFFPCKAGDRIEASAYFGRDNTGSVVAVVVFFSGSGAYVSQTEVATSTAAPDGGGDLSTYGRIGGFATAPAGSGRAVLLVKGVAAGSGPRLRVALPYIGLATSDQTSLSPWSVGFDGVPGADITSANTAAAISGQGWGATASEANASNARVNFGKNLIRNSNMESDGRGFKAIGNSTGHASVAGPSSTGGVNHFYHYVVPASAVATVLSVGNDGAINPIPVVAGQRYAFAAELAYGSGTIAELTLIFYDSGGNYITEATHVSHTSGGFVRIGGFVTAPSGAVRSDILGIVRSNGGTYTDIEMRRPMVSEATATQTELPQYTPGETRIQYITDSGNIYDWRALPTNYSVGAGASRSVEYPLSSSSTSSIAVAAHSAYLVNQTLSLPSATISGLSTGTIYDVFRDLQGGSYVASPIGSSASYFTSPSRYLYIGTQSTQTGGGGYTSPPPPPPGNRGDWIP